MDSYSLKAQDQTYSETKWAESVKEAVETIYSNLMHLYLCDNKIGSNSQFFALLTLCMIYVFLIMVVIKRALKIA